MIDLAKINAARMGHNYFMALNKGEYTLSDLNILNGYVNYLSGSTELPRKKVGLMFIAVNPHYWQYAKQVIADAKELFLPGHEVEILLLSDVPEEGSAAEQALIDACPPDEQLAEIQKTNPTAVSKSYIKNTVRDIRQSGAKILPVESVGWPYPTLMRFHMFLQHEEYLAQFEYLFYLDLDMRIINVVGDEILGDGLTAAQHPMYAVRKELMPPYEPNPESAAYFPRPGRVVVEQGVPRFEPLYFAGGFQGGKTDQFIAAMKVMKKTIDEDFNRNYIAIWNDETHWNKYLFIHPPAVVLDPSYVYPDSMINEYYLKVWGRNFNPRIMTLTKKFSLSKEGGDAAKQMMQTL